MFELLAYVALVVITTGLPLGVWTRARWPRRRADRQLYRLIRTSTRRTAR
ncbi:hypothetical protein HUF15_00685 [Streptomyces samsunensis]|nr:hypothetical protein [Streptomyces samsunensis]NUH35297.1 hypothetical protein [Streptomyces samsunensis]